MEGFCLPQKRVCKWETVNAINKSTLIPSRWFNSKPSVVKLDLTVSVRLDSCGFCTSAAGRVCCLRLDS